MIPTLPYIQNKFKEYNALLFEDKLPLLPIRIGHARTSLGGVRYAKRRNVFGKWSYSDFSMVISAHFDLSEQEIQDTLIHEMIHYYILYHQIHDTSAHGEIFQRMMNEINVKHNRHITISHRMTSEVAERSTRVKAHYFCVSELKDGRMGITVAAKTRIFSLWNQLPKYFPIVRMSWYGSTDPYFNRFPSALKPKIYVVDAEDLQKHLGGAVSLVNDGHTIRPR